MNNDFELEDLFDVVVEPEHSKSELIRMQMKYNMTTEDFMKSDYSDLSFTLADNEIEYWSYQYEMYLEAEGDPEELISEYFSMVLYNDFPFDDNPSFNKIEENSDKKEVSTTSFSFASYIFSVWVMLNWFGLHIISLTSSPLEGWNNNVERQLRATIAVSALIAITC